MGGQALNLRRVSAPLFVEENSGLNDNLNGVERPVSFDIPDVGATGQVVHSLAKWKRLALKRYDFKPGKGLFTDMNAIRRDEEVDNLHSVYVDQWDWEKVIERQDRNEQFLRQTVRAIVGAVVETNDALQIAFPSLHTVLVQSKADKASTSELLKQVQPHDLLKFGIIPELVGRLPVISPLEALTREDLVRILTEPKNALVKQYKALLAYDGVALEFQQGALEAVADKAIERNIGARGLRAAHCACATPVSAR